MEDIVTFLPYVAMIGVFYFLMIRPQQKRAKAEKEFESQLKVGDRIITKSGMYGKVVDLHDSDSSCIVETMAGKIKFDRSAISMELSKKLNVPATTDKK